MEHNCRPELACHGCMCYTRRMVRDQEDLLESERRRLAALLQREVVEPLNLLLAQVRATEHALRANAEAHVTVSVLVGLAQQVAQRARDLASGLQPTVLETLGLEPALQALAGQAMRSSGLRVELHLERLPERLPWQIELALFRAAQDALERAAHQAHASCLAIHLACREGQLAFSLADDGDVALGAAALEGARQQIERLGGAVQIGAGTRGGLCFSASLLMQPPARLTPREMDVIRLLAQGLSNAEIAQALTVSPRTVNFHLDNIYTKLGVSSRTEAAICALRHGWTADKPPSW